MLKPGPVQKKAIASAPHGAYGISNKEVQVQELSSSVGKSIFRQNC